MHPGASWRLEPLGHPELSPLILFLREMIREIRATYRGKEKEKIVKMETRNLKPKKLFSVLSLRLKKKKIMVLQNYIIARAFFFFLLRVIPYNIRN